MRLRRKPHLASRLERCEYLIIKEPKEFRGRWLEEFGKHGKHDVPGELKGPGELCRPGELDGLGEHEVPGEIEAFCKNLHIELGCGKGRFTVETAKATPEVFIIGLEKLADAILTGLERADADSLQNIRFINSLADNLTDYFAPGEVSRIYINFCDPWPAIRHEKRRLTSSSFLEMYKQILSNDGDIRFKTDNLPLFEYSLNELELRGFMIAEICRDLHKNGPVGIMTDYEQKFHEQGQPIYYARATLS